MERSSPQLNPNQAPVSFCVFSSPWFTQINTQDVTNSSCENAECYRYFLPRRHSAHKIMSEKHPNFSGLEKRGSKWSFCCQRRTYIQVLSEWVSNHWQAWAMPTAEESRSWENRSPLSTHALAVLWGCVQLKIDICQAQYTELTLLSQGHRGTREAWGGWSGSCWPSSIPPAEDGSILSNTFQRTAGAASLTIFQ